MGTIRLTFSKMNIIFLNNWVDRYIILLEEVMREQFPPESGSSVINWGGKKKIHNIIIPN